MTKTCHPDTMSPRHPITRFRRIRIATRPEFAQFHKVVHDLAIQVARLTQAVEPLARMQEEQTRLSARVAGLEGFKSAITWALGFVATAGIIRYGATLFRP